MEGMNRRSNWVMLGFALAFAAVLGLAAQAYFSRYAELSSANLELFIRGFGAQAAAVYFLAYLLSSPIPFLAPVLAATGGLLFGPVWGTLLAVLSATATSLVPFLISRRLGRAWVQAKLRGSRLEDMLQRANHGGFGFVLLLRLVPLMPWELQNYVAGVSAVPVPIYLLATLLGSAPLSIALVLLGAAAKDPASWQFLAALALTAVVLLAPILTVVYQNRRGKGVKAQ